MRNLFASVAILSGLCVGHLLAGPIDPLGPEGPDIGVDNLYLLAPAPICFEIGGDSDCLENVALTATSADTDTFSGGGEIIDFQGQLSGTFTQNGVDMGDWLIPYDSHGGSSDIELGLPDRGSLSEGTFTSDFANFDFAGTLPVLGSVEINQDGAPLTTGQTTIGAPNGNGLYPMTSFFDIFTEISLDGGHSFIPSNQTSSEFDLVASPEPASVGMMLVGLGGLVMVLRRKRA